MRKQDNHQEKLKRQFDRSLLPEPFHYYRHEFPAFSMCGEWVQVHCCFHKDTQPSLSIHLVSGGFHCFACGAKGGDVIAFPLPPLCGVVFRSGQFFWSVELCRLKLHNKRLGAFQLRKLLAGLNP